MTQNPELSNYPKGADIVNETSKSENIKPEFSQAGWTKENIQNTTPKGMVIAVAVMFVISVMIFGYSLFIFGVSRGNNPTSRVAGVNDAGSLQSNMTRSNASSDIIDTSTNSTSSSRIQSSMQSQSQTTSSQTTAMSSSVSSSPLSPKYVELVAKNSREPGLNWRSEPCGQTLGVVKKWGTTGVIMEGPVKRSCLGGDWEWYRVQWFDGSIGWSISEYMNLSATPLKGSIARLSGVVDFYQYFVDNNPSSPASAASYKVCARLIDPSKEIFCTQNYNPTQTREYAMELKAGKYYIEVLYYNAANQEVRKAYFTTALECQFKTPDSQTCYIANRQAVVELTGGQNLTNVNPVDFSDNARLEV